jgi:hypothetical protein
LPLEVLVDRRLRGPFEDRPEGVEVSALRKLLRIECTLKRFAVSPHSSRTTPSTTIMTAAVWMVAAYVLARWSLSVDQPSDSGDGARSHGVPG